MSVETDSGNRKTLSVWRGILEQARVLIRRCWGGAVCGCLSSALRVMRPFKSLRVVWVQTEGIGHLAFNTDAFLRRSLASRSAGGEPATLGIAPRHTANDQLLAMFARRFPILRSDLAHALLAPAFDRQASRWFESLWHYHPNAVPRYTLECRRPLLAFNVDEERAGRECLRLMGLPEGTWFACFHARDSAYMARTSPGVRWSYHDFRDCDVGNYMEAASYLSGCGGYAIRMGAHVEKPLDGITNPRIIDYACRHRSAFADVFLLANAKFFLGNTSGLMMVSTIFGVPVALANYVPLEFLTFALEGDLFIPKKIWSTRERRFLTFREILESGVGRFHRGEQYAREELEPVENNAGEIADLAREMNQRLDGTFEVTSDDEELQRRFRSLFRPHHYCYGTPVRIGAAFLRKNADLIG